MMRIFNILKANDEIKTLSAKVSELSEFNDQLKKENESLKQKQEAVTLATHDWAAEKETLVKSHEDAVKALVEKHESEIKTFKDSVTEAEVSASSQAAVMLASIGVEPETVSLAVSNDELVTANGRKYKVIPYKS